MLKMYAKITGTINGLQLPDYIRTGAGMSFGGYCFDISVKGKTHSINFDFPGSAVFVQNDALILEAGANTVFWKNDDLDDCYDEEYKAHGIARSDLTASVLATTTKIEDFVIDCDEAIDYQILSILFVDDTGKYEVSTDVIDAYNQSLKAMSKERYRKTMDLVARAEEIEREISSDDEIEIDEYEGDIWISKYSASRGRAECIERFCSKSEIDMEILGHECNLNSWFAVL